MMMPICILLGISGIYHEIYTRVYSSCERNEN